MHTPFFSYGFLCAYFKISVHVFVFLVVGRISNIVSAAYLFTKVKELLYLQPGKPKVSGLYSLQPVSVSRALLVQMGCEMPAIICGVVLSYANSLLLKWS